MKHRAGYYIGPAFCWVGACLWLWVIAHLRDYQSDDAGVLFSAAMVCLYGGVVISLWANVREWLERRR
jgi:hypothetical protein